jgi:hypothetical protein
MKSLHRRSICNLASPVNSVVVPLRRGFAPLARDAQGYSNCPVSSR